MTAYKVGDIALLPFPFTDLQTLKQRPALVLAWVESKHLSPLAVVAMITGKVDSEKLLGDYLLKDWESAGLLKPSKLRLGKLVSVEEPLLKKRLGTLTKADQDGVRREFWRVFSDWK
jgi:mRNA interferase MazF